MGPATAEDVEAPDARPRVMPVRKIGDCYQWGKSGKRYCGPGAKKKALKQAAAIKASQARRGR